MKRLRIRLGETYSEHTRCHGRANGLAVGHVVRFGGEGDWTLTHEESGRWIGLFRSKAKALRAMRAVAPLFDWRLPQAEAAHELVELGGFFSALIIDLGATSAGGAA